MKHEFIYPLGTLELKRSDRAFAAGEIAFGRPADIDERAISIQGEKPLKREHGDEAS